MNFFSSSSSLCNATAGFLCETKYEGCKEITAGRIELCECVQAFGDCLASINCTSSAWYSTFQDLCKQYNCHCGESLWRTYVIYTAISAGSLFLFFFVWAMAIRYNQRHGRYFFWQQTARDSFDSLMPTEEDALIAQAQQRSLLESQQQNYHSTNKPILVVPENIAETEPQQIQTATETDKKSTTSTPEINPQQKPQTSKICRVCLDKPVDSVFVPCGHRVACVACGMKLSRCCVCRAELKMVVKTYD